ncbi:MAG: hypothetical protein GF353_21690 [Candidatus Lokiarchaeota archaeon]|nr:hypothetical protein [Candidatus Lokiarchaeota archaeon]
MDFIELIDKLKLKDASMVLYSLLNRIPIIIFGNEFEEIENILVELSEAIPFRKEYIYNSDFISEQEYENLTLNESNDYKTKRITIRCPSYISFKALKELKTFNSWLIGINTSDQGEETKILNLVKEKIRKFLFINISREGIGVEFKGGSKKDLDISFEKKILQKVSQDTERSIERMKRVLSDKMNQNEMDKNLADFVLNFEVEKNELKKNIFNREIQNFYSGSRRAFFILSKISFLNNFSPDNKISNKTVLETIDYEDVSIERIILFIQREWNEDFKNLVDFNKKLILKNAIKSFWG